MATIVIVHGGWDGGWFWKQPAEELRKSGHIVYTPTLTGLGERVHLGTPETDLHTHVQDVMNVLIFEELNEVVLVGHSYGGTVLSGVAEQVPDRIARLVYLDAFVLEPGKSLADLYEGGAVGGMFQSLADRHGDGWRVPFPGPEAYDTRVMAHPVKTFLTPLKLDNPSAARLPRTYIACTQRGTNPVMEPLFVCAAKAKTAGWDYHELTANHNPHVSKLHETVQLLHLVASRSA